METKIFNELDFKMLYSKAFNQIMIDIDLFGIVETRDVIKEAILVTMNLTTEHICKKNIVFDLDN